MKYKEIHLGGINIALLDSQESLVEALVDIFRKKGFASLTAVNPEKIMSAMAREDVRAAILNSSIRYADGIGIVLAVRHKYGISTPRLPGCEVWEKLMEHAGQNDMPVYLVGAKDYVVKETREKLTANYETPIVGICDGYFKSDDEVIENIKKSGAKIVTVALGSPRQEQFIQKCKVNGIQAIYMGVGGTYDAYIGNVKRAPVIWQKLGLEWMYRLLKQPTRIGRQLNLLKFAYMALTNKL
jgi:UDP-N-acetyl-D-mannosaminouronate:lipid I N-acetyl-D-mannosaminouronosyltransferase